MSAAAMLLLRPNNHLEVRIRVPEHQRIRIVLEPRLPKILKLRAAKQTIGKKWHWELEKRNLT